MERPDALVSRVETGEYPMFMITITTKILFNS